MLEYTEDTQTNRLLNALCVKLRDIQNINWI